ncbi:MAG: hypothetical protein ACR2O6_11620 [Ilumatobacteraceae bacterium]
MKLRPDRFLVAGLASMTLLVGASGDIGAAPTQQRTTSDLPAMHHVGQREKLPSIRQPLCTSIAHVGDSTTVESYDQQVAAYTELFDGVVVDGGGGRAVLQTLAADRHTGAGAAESIRASGFTGCWVVAMGTNDAANIAAGANYSRERVIDSMMAAIDPSGSTPVAWVEVFTTKTSGYWKSANMVAWNDALRSATTRWPNLRILPWSSHVAANSGWISDGIHHTAEGRVRRAEWIASNAYEILNR